MAGHAAALRAKPRPGLDAAARMPPSFRRPATCRVPPARRPRSPPAPRSRARPRARRSRARGRSRARSGGEHARASSPSTRPAPRLARAARDQSLGQARRRRRRAPAAAAPPRRPREAIVAIGAERSGGDQLRAGRGWSRRPPARRRATGAVAADALHLALLQQRAAACTAGAAAARRSRRETACRRRPARPARAAPRSRAGERAALVTEELGFDQLGGERAAIDRHERRRRRGPIAMDGARQQLFAGSGLALNEHRGVGMRRATRSSGAAAPRSSRRGHRVGAGADACPSASRRSAASDHMAATLWPRHESGQCRRVADRRTSEPPDDASRRSPPRRAERYRGCACAPPQPVNDRRWLNTARMRPGLTATSHSSSQASSSKSSSSHSASERPPSARSGA